MVLVALLVSIWAVNTLTGTYSNEGSTDFMKDRIVSTDSQARKACMDLGVGADLPAKEDGLAV